MHHEENWAFPNFSRMAPGRIPDHCTRGKLRVINDRDYIWGSYIWNMFIRLPFQTREMPLE